MQNENQIDSSQRAVGRRRWNLQVDLEDVAGEGPDREYRELWRQQTLDNTALNDVNVRNERMLMVN